jgi:hypothetical protein
MRLVARSLLTVSFAVLAAAVAWPQSLAEIAAREKARQEKERRKAGGASKVITEDDLRGRGAGTYSQPGTGTTAASPAASPSPGASPGAEKPKTDDELRAEAEKAWRDKLQHFQGEVTRLNEVVSSLQADVNDSYVAVYSAGRARQVARLEEAQKSLAAAKQQVIDLEEEGRRNRYR